MTSTRLFDSAKPVARMFTSLPGVRPSFCSARLVANSTVVPGRLMPTVLPRNCSIVVIDGCAANFHADGPKVPMIANGKPLAAETMVVEPGAPRISTSPLANAPIAALPAAITTKLTFKPYFSNKPASLAIHNGMRLPVTEA